MLDTVLNALKVNAVVIVLTIVVGFVVAKLIIAIMDKLISKMRVEKTLIRFFKSVFNGVVYFIWILVVAHQATFDKYFVAMASIISAAIALAAQGSLSNLLGGVLLLMSKPFLVGDYVIAGGVEGTVLAIGMLNTQINTADNKRVSVPNSTISGATISNCSTEGKRRVDEEFSVSYETPVDEVKRAIMEAVSELDKVLNDPAPPFVRISNYKDSSVCYAVRVWCLTADYWDVHFDLLEKVKEAFDRNGVEMTYNHMILHMK